MSQINKNLGNNYSTSNYQTHSFYHPRQILNDGGGSGIEFEMQSKQVRSLEITNCIYK